MLNCKCVECGIDFQSKTNRGAKFCSPKCSNKNTVAKRNTDEAKQERIRKSHIKFTDDNKDSWIECQVCSFRGVEIISHVKSAHNMTPDEYKKEYKVPTLKSKIACERISGDKNPGYQHGGTLSPWSEKNERFNAEQIKENQKVAGENAAKKSKRTKTYWIEQEGMTEEEAQKAVSNHQRRGLEYWQERYGDEEGLKFWKARQEKWQETLNSKSDEEKREINRKKISKGSISIAEKEIYETIKTVFPELNSQFSIIKNNKSYIYDIVYENKIIEYNGTYWHCDPEVYDSEYFNKKIGSKAKEIWAKDSEKIKFAKDAGYEIMILWERDYKANKKEKLKECIHFLTQ
jgi:DNA-directed RNA polymerase subunit RPC12/RpoP